MRNLLEILFIALVGAMVITCICASVYQNAFNNGFDEGIKSSAPCFETNGNCVPYRNYVQQAGGN